MIFTGSWEVGKVEGLPHASLAVFCTLRNAREKVHELSAALRIASIKTALEFIAALRTPRAAAPKKALEFIAALRTARAAAPKKALEFIAGLRSPRAAAPKKALEFTAATRTPRQATLQPFPPSQLPVKSSGAIP